MVIDSTKYFPTEFGNGITVSSGIVQVNYARDNCFESSIEAPVRILGGSCLDIKEMGAFCFINLGSMIRRVVKMGRFVMIGPEVFIGGNPHSVKSLSAHLMFRGKCDDWFKSFTEFYEDTENAKKIYLSQEEELARKSNIVIGNDVWIGARAIITGGVTIGDGAIIGTGAIVTKDVEPYTIVGGSPARVIRKRFNDDIIERLMRVQWWDYGPDILKGIDITEVDSGIDELEARVASGKYSKWNTSRFIFRGNNVYKEGMSGKKELLYKLPL